MDSEYYIALQIKTPNGYETYTEFFLGKNHLEATSFFETLRGSNRITYDSILLMELRTVRQGLPIDIRMKHCTLDEITENFRTITKYIFNSLNLKKS